MPDKDYEVLVPDLPPQESALELVQERLQYMLKVKEFALQHTTEHDWVIMSGRQGKQVPYLQSSGAEKIARLFGVKVTNVRSEKYMKDPVDPGQPRSYVWEYTATFSLRGQDDCMEVPGSRSSDDGFFSNQARVDERDVKMAAYSNMLVNGITRLLGLRGFTMETLQEAGLDPSRMQGVQFRGESSPAPPPERSAPSRKPSATRARAKSPEPEEAGESTVQKLDSLIVQIVGVDPDARADFLEHITMFRGKDGKMVSGIRDIARLSGKRLEVTYGMLQEAVDRGDYNLNCDPQGNFLNQ
jgi:hypothetical protein